MKMSVIILAGGRSTRMGKNKLLLPLGDTTIIGHLIDRVVSLFEKCIVVTDQPEDYRDLPVTIAGDLFPCSVKNSLVGIHGGLSASPYTNNFVVAGDMPFLDPAVVRYICSLHSGYDMVIPYHERHFQPLCSVYSKSCLPYIESLLAEARYKISNLLDYVRVCHVDTEKIRAYDSELLSFFNLNTPTDFLRAKQIFAKNNSEQRNIKLA